jgi:MFS family permease
MDLSVRRQPSSTPVLLVAAFGAFLAFLDSTIVNIAFPNIQKSFPTYAISSLSWVLNAYNIVFAAFLVAAGKLADLLGRKRMFVCGAETLMRTMMMGSDLAAATTIAEADVVIRPGSRGVGLLNSIRSTRPAKQAAPPPARRCRKYLRWCTGR